jgi:hypothetical protein
MVVLISIANIYKMEMDAKVFHRKYLWLTKLIMNSHGE